MATGDQRLSPPVVGDGRLRLQRGVIDFIDSLPLSAEAPLSRDGPIQSLVRMGAFDWLVQENSVLISENLQRLAGIEWSTAPLEALLLRAHADDRVGLETVIRSASLDGKPFHRTIRIPSLDGSVRWFDVAGKGVGNGGNGINRVTVVCQDITQSKKNEEELEASRKRIQEILSSITDHYCTCNASFVLTDASPRAMTFFGLSPDTIRHFDLLTAFPEDANPGLALTLSHSLRARVPLHRELHAPATDRWASVHAYPSNEGMVIYFTDISERRRNGEELTRANKELEPEIEAGKKSQRALESSELQHRAVVEVQTELVCRFTSRWNLSFANDAFCAFFGIEKRSVESTFFWSFLHPADRAWVQEQFMSVRRENRIICLDDRVIRSDRSVRWIQWTAQALFEENGDIREFQASGRDITSEKHAEILRSVQYEVSFALAEAKDLPEAMYRSLRSICRRIGWNEAVLWPIADGVVKRECENRWRPLAERSDAELMHTELPERVLVEKRSMWINGLPSALHEYCSALAFPVRAGDQITAVIECFSCEEMNIQPEIVETLEAIGHQIGSYRERQFAEESLRMVAEQLEERVRQRTEQLAGALEALSNSETRFRAMFQEAPMGIALVSMTGHITERNPALERMLGYSGDTLDGMKFEDLIHPDDWEIASRQFSDLLGGVHRQFRAELRFLARDGVTVWGSLSTSVLSFDTVKSPFVIVMVKDVTERRKIEIRLRERETRLRTIVEEAPVGITLLNRDGVLIQSNHAFVEMMGMPNGMPAGTTLGEFLVGKELDEDIELHQAMVEGRMDRYQREQPYHKHDGSLAWGHLNATAVRSPEGTFLYSLRLVEDTTRKRETEQQVRMLAHTITSMNESVIITDTKFVIVSVNTAFCGAFGYDESEVLGRHLKVLRTHEASSTTLRTMASMTFAGGWTGELMVRRKNGEVFPVMISTSLVRDEHGNPIALVGIARDITEQKLLQSQLDLAERQRSEDLRRFAVSVQRAQEEERQRISRELHDDICQRLSGMKLNMEVLADDVKDRDKRTSRTLRRFMKQFEQTINDIRRMSSNLRPAVLDDFGLPIAINLLVREFESQTRIPVTVDTGEPTLEHLHPEVEIALYRIAQEGLANIAKHANPSSVVIRLTQHPASVELLVSDDGRGFDDQDSIQAKKEGHGLGLISMRERAELLGGSISVSTAKNQGTTIHVTIPFEGKPRR